MERLPGHLAVFLALVTCCSSALAQSADIDAWMERHFSGKPGVKQDAKADQALYAALGLDSLRKNRFIGEVQGTARLPNGSMPVQYILWTDTLEAILHLTRPGDTTTYVADLRTNTIAIHTTSTSAGEVNSSLADLRERVVVNWYRNRDDGSPWRVNRVKPYNTKGGVLAEQDMQRWTVITGDTIRFVRDKHGPSPFLDALEWMPYGGEYPFNLLMQLARAGDPMPRHLQSSAGTINAKIMGMGTRPRPIHPFSGTVKDLRPRTHEALPIRRSDRRANIVELDPGIEIPENEGHLWGTADPGNPGEPEMTYSGRRSQMRLHTKEPCGEAGTVVVKVWIDRMGQVQQAEVDPLKSTLRSEVCWASAVEAAKRDTYYPMEGGIPPHAGELVFSYRSIRSGSPGSDGRPSGYHSGGNGPGSGAPPLPPFSCQLPGRTLITRPDLSQLPQGQGKVMIDIQVDRKGQIGSATLNERGSTTRANDLVEAARRAALDCRFSADEEAPDPQRGRVIIQFEME
ncbi:MAG: hypothetical protein ACO1NQ_01180 [Flavobacteriales bacterium]